LGHVWQVRASGGGTKGALWRQILASVLEAELATVNTTEGAAYGAALLTGVGAGAWTDVPAACATAVKVTGSTCPDPTKVEAYRRGYALYRELYPALKPTFSKMIG
jgi:xylulokinase